MELLAQLLAEATKRKDILTMIRKGELDKSTAKEMLKELDKIIAKYAKGDDYEFSKNFLDRGVVYNGTDTKAAEKVADKIIGDLYGYFLDGLSRRAQMQIKKSNRKIGKISQEVWEVRPHEGKPQVEFFYTPRIESGTSIIGIVINL